MRQLLLLGLLFMSLTGPPAQAQRCARGTLIAEVTHVRDGDTIEVGGLPIRLQGLARISQTRKRDGNFERTWGGSDGG